MHQTQLKSQTSIKVVSQDEVVLVPNGQIRSDRETVLPGNCFIVPMIVLREPEQVKRVQTKNRK